MNVTFASTWDSRCGVATYSRSLVAELEKKSKVEIVSLDAGSISSPARLAARLNQGDVAHIQHQYPFFGGMAIHKNWFRQTVSKVNIPLVVTVHELDLGDQDSIPIRLYKRWFNRFLFSPPEIYRFIVHSSVYRDRLKGIGIDPRDISVVPEGVPSVRQPGISSRNAKSLLGVSGKRVVTIFGFVVKRKGYDLALDMIRKLPNDVVLLIAGGPHPDDRTGFFDDLKYTVETDRLSDRVVITDYLEDSRIPIVMAATDLIIAPFTSMSNSGSILRSIAYGKPVLTADLEWSRELNERCEGLMLFDAGDSINLAERVQELLDDKGLMESASSASRIYAQSWSVAKAAAETISIYEDISSL
ncbi:MAG: glycosyltransferase [Armatimonadota bacterium]